MTSSSAVSPSSPRAAVTPAGAAPGPDPRRWYALAVTAVAQLVVLLDSTIVTIALPSAQADLGMGDGSRQWVITSYSLALGGLLLLGGRLVDIIGGKRAFMAGLVGFAAASAVGGAAGGPGVLFAARATQGVFAALLLPAALSLLITTFTEPKERGKAFGVYGAVSGVGSATGQFVGGLLTEYLNWRWCMYVNVPIVLAAVVAAAIVLPDRRGSSEIRLDIPGVLLGCGGLTAVVYGCSEAESHGWISTLVLGTLAAGALLLALFAVRQTSARWPVLPPAVVRDRRRAGALLVSGLGQVAMFALLLFMTYYLQVVLGYSAVATGAAFLPLTVAMTIGVTQIAARLTPRVAPRQLIVPALLVAALGMLLLTQVDTSSSYVAGVLPALVLFGLGLGGAGMAAMVAATSGVPPRDSGVASAMVTTSQQVGGAIGTAVLNTVAASAAARQLAHATPAASMVHGFTVAQWVVVALLVATAVLAAVLIDSPAPNRADPRSRAETSGV
ncbi:MFS transporter [Streptomyces cavernicola]|uniref:MFS transporter n=1 Tax=Streptomyces cavernicola TaxID=3043613 RepID=A0ABT6SJM7_9ACTN|nr:MFS transporter [Streptomyces sp. B-S-A6]MDI3408239.1 MFS transporter [Streptomyces sp. B-S-A6]